MTTGPAFLFDLDGTLVDSVYQPCSPGVDNRDFHDQLAPLRIERELVLAR